MKRSEAIDLIWDKLNEYEDHGGHIQALHILDALMEAGMGPPRIEIEINTGTYEFNGEIIAHVTKRSYDRKWEPEHD